MRLQNSMREMTERDREPLFSRRWLYLLLAMSVATNAVLIIRLNYPQALPRLALLMHPVPAANEADRAVGRSDAAITVIEYADFQCPFCAEMHKAMSSIVRERNVRWIYRHYPLLEVHPRALAAAEAVECAGDQGKFWEFAAELYARQTDLQTLPFDTVAAATGVDPAPLRRCLAAGKYRDVVISQMRDGERMRINGTPTYFINGKRFEGFRSADDLRKIIVPN